MPPCLSGAYSGDTLRRTQHSNRASNMKSLPPPNTVKTRSSRIGSPADRLVSTTTNAAVAWKDPFQSHRLNIPNGVLPFGFGIRSSGQCFYEAILKP